MHHIAVGDAAGAALAGIGVTVRQDVINGILGAVHRIVYHVAGCGVLVKLGVIGCVARVAGRAAGTIGGAVGTANTGLSGIGSLVLRGGLRGVV